MDYRQIFKPLAFKGPDNQLRQLFGDTLLYQGVRFLLRDELLEWHHEKQEQLIIGRFFSNKKLHKITLPWPLCLVQSHCQCLPDSQSEDPCQHKAALAIAAKAEIDQLPLLIKPRQKAQTDSEYFKQWLKKPGFDPYPNMARHRLAYIVKPADQGFVISLLKSYLNKDGSYTPKAEFDPSGISVEKRPKFVTDTDLWLLDQIAGMGRWSEENKGWLLPVECEAIFVRILLLSERCFWRSGHRKPLRLVPAAAKETAQQSFFAGFQFSSTMQSVFEDSSLHGEQSAIFDKETVESPVFHLTLASTHSSRSLANQVRIDHARFQIELGHQSYSLESWLNIAQRSHKEHAQWVWRAVRMLDILPGIHQVMEPLEAEAFQLGDRLLLPATEVNWLLLYCLHQHGWKIDFDKSFFMDQLSIDDWYIKVEARQKRAEKRRITPKDTATENQLAFDFGADTRPISLDRASEDDDWFRIELGVTVKGKKVSLVPWLETLVYSDKDSSVEVKLDSGELISLPAERVNMIRRAFFELVVNRKEREQSLTVQKSQLVLLSELQSATDINWLTSNRIKNLASLLANQKVRRAARLPQSLQAELRGYQKHGLAWLQFLWQQGFSGILADDMGLGKTLQTIAHILRLKQDGELFAPVLIVLPTSLMFNWLQEFKRFAPDLQVVTYFGQQRKKQRDYILKQDVVITTYGVMARDIEWLDRTLFSLAVLDEAQNIKNHKTQNAKAACRLMAKARLCLTGTPVENHLGELWSLFHFLMPGFLGNQRQFNRNFREPIEVHNDRTRAKILSQRLQPFLLRRLKEEVATELPAKTEIHEYLPLTEQQSDIYELVRVSANNELMKQLQTSGQQSNSVLIANALLRLRQICCHPALVSEQLGKQIEYSNKYAWLAEKLPEFVENNRHVLIFSQFTRVLSDLEKMLDELNISYLTLTGQTQNRAELVEQFQSGDASVFLISLKAGGTGLNLTRADTVIHIDPWWNAAAELQASDRAYRIGQDKPVFVYKLISENTVEQRIQSLQQSKSKLADDLFSAASGNKLSNEEWMDLLKPMEEFELTD